MKKSISLLLSCILGTGLFIYFIFDFASCLGSDIGIDILAFFVMAPFAVLLFFALIFSWVGFGSNGRWAALVAAILHTINLVVVIIYTLLDLNVLILILVFTQMILCYVAFGTMKRRPIYVQPLR